jgi:hypothetical protein
MESRLSRALLTIGTLAIVGAGAYFVLRKRPGKSSRVDRPYRRDVIDLYIEESFPASDAPSFTPIEHIGGPN